MYQQQGKQTGQEPCPKCRKEGHDRKGNNLKLFSNGSKHCFRCGYHLNGSKANIYIPAKSTVNQLSWELPNDSSTLIGKKGLDWLAQYDVSFQDRIAHRVLWSESNQWLIFPISEHGEVVGFQARNFNTTKPYKWFNKFNTRKVLKIIPNKQSDKLVLVEDLISAIKVSKVFNAAPIFGSHLSPIEIRKYLPYANTIILWLDRDKASDSLKYSAQARSFGINCTSVVTTLDPKLYSLDEIKSIVEKTSDVTGNRTA